MNERRVTHLWRVREIVVRRLRSRGRVVCVRRRREASWSGEYVYDTHGIVTLPTETSDSRLGARGVDFLTFPFGIAVGRDVSFIEPISASWETRVASSVSRGDRARRGGDGASSASAER